MYKENRVLFIVHWKFWYGFWLKYINCKYVFYLILRSHLYGQENRGDIIVLCISLVIDLSRHDTLKEFSNKIFVKITRRQKRGFDAIVSFVENARKASKLIRSENKLITKPSANMLRKSGYVDKIKHIRHTITRYIRFNNKNNPEECQKCFINNKIYTYIIWYYV